MYIYDIIYFHFRDIKTSEDANYISTPWRNGLLAACLLLASLFNAVVVVVVCVCVSTCREKRKEGGICMNDME